MSKIDWRPILPDDLREYGTVIDAAFRLSSPLHYLNDFPVWEPTIPNQPNRFQLGGWTEGRLAVTASLRIAPYRTETETLSLGLIGAVATNPADQGKGLGSEVLGALIAEGESRGVDAFALWGSESPLYKKHGFDFAGIQVRSTFDHLKIEGELLSGFEVRTGWEESIAEILLTRKQGLLYRDADILWLSRHRGVEWRTLWQEGKCIAYCGWNRGIDLANLVHELGGSDIGMRTLLEFITRRYTFLELLHHPSLEAIGITSWADPEYLAQFRTMNTAKVTPQVLEKIWLSGMDSC